MSEPATGAGGYEPPRGYFGIGAEGTSKPANLGALFRTAHAFGASFLFTVGASLNQARARDADTSNAPLHLPTHVFASAEELLLPKGCVLVGVEFDPDAVLLPSFRHPTRAAYVLGPERSSLSEAMRARCGHLVRIPTRFALNLAVAGAVVMYDRWLTRGRFAPRPVGSGGPVEGRVAAPGHGKPRFRGEVPKLLREP